MDIDELSFSDCSELSEPPTSLVPPEGFFLPSPDESSAGRSQDEDLPPARKKRRVAPKERSTEVLDLHPRIDLSYGEQQSQIDLLVNTIRRHRKIVVIAGAGISTSAGSMHPASPAASCANVLHSSRLSLRRWPF